MKRQLGTLTSADLGAQMKGPPPTNTRGVPRNAATITGRLDSVHHFRVGDQDYTACIVRVQRTAAQVKAKEPDCREIRGTADTEVEVTRNG